jgi:RNA polymerase sigma-70 factor (ECF subfamily)
LSYTSQQPQGQEAEKFAALLVESRPALVRYFSPRVHAQQEIEDLVHDVLVRLVRNRDFAEGEGVRGYVFQTANSVLVDHIRRCATNRTELQAPADLESHEDEGFGPDRVLQGRQELARATAILMELPERTRTVFILRRMEGMKFAEISARLGISVSAVEKHMVRATEKLQAGLERGR